jgi:hypothetical protein
LTLSSYCLSLNPLHRWHPSVAEYVISRIPTSQMHDITD